MNLLESLKDSLPRSLRHPASDRRGRNATVYLARDLRQDRPVALKLLSPSRTPLFKDTFWSSDRRAAYDVSPSGQFMMLQSSSDDGRAVVVVNWLDEVKSRLARDAQHD